MTKYRNIKDKVVSVIFWSVISAAFIGPGTVTTASTAGSLFGLDLAWALAFATLACVVLQEAAARITISSKMTLGEAISLKFGSNRIRMALGISIIFGCAAYEAGNMLGAVSGIQLVSDLSNQTITIIVFILAGTLLWLGTGKNLVKALGLVVALMGIMFIIAAMGVGYSWFEIAGSAFKPSIPEGSGILIIGLIGTTIVPYNLFLGSGISEGQSIPEMRTGLVTAILLGGFISLAVLVAGTSVQGEMTFPNLKESLSVTGGSLAGNLFGWGLFAAAFTSVITAPLASAITGQSLLSKPGQKWKMWSTNFRLVWLGVLLTGFVFGISGIKPIPVIILAQALNGFLLPFVAVLILLIINDRKIMKEQVNSRVLNWLTLFIVCVVIFLGLNNFYKAVMTAAGLKIGTSYLYYIVGLSVLVSIYFGWRIRSDKNHTEHTN